MKALGTQLFWKWFGTFFGWNNMVDHGGILLISKISIRNIVSKLVHCCQEKSQSWMICTVIDMSTRKPSLRGANWRNARNSSSFSLFRIVFHDICVDFNVQQSNPHKKKPWFWACCLGASDSPKANPPSLVEPSWTAPGDGWGTVSAPKTSCRLRRKEAMSSNLRDFCLKYPSSHRYIYKHILYYIYIWGYDGDKRWCFLFGPRLLPSSQFWKAFVFQTLSIKGASQVEDVERSWSVECHVWPVYPQGDKTCQFSSCHLSKVEVHVPTWVLFIP